MCPPPINGSTGVSARKCEEFMGDDNYGGVVFAAAVLVSLPCFLSCVYMVYECIFILWLWTCGKPAIGVLHSFTWPTRDGLTFLCCCNRAKWHHYEDYYTTCVLLVLNEPQGNYVRENFAWFQTTDDGSLERFGQGYKQQPISWIRSYGSTWNTLLYSIHFAGTTIECD